MCLCCFCAHFCIVSAFVSAPSSVSVSECYQCLKVCLHLCLCCFSDMCMCVWAVYLTGNPRTILCFYILHLDSGRTTKCFYKSNQLLIRFCRCLIYSHAYHKNEPIRSRNKIVYRG